MVLPAFALPLVGAALDRLVGGGGQRGGNAPPQQGAPQHPQPINIHIDLPFNIRNDNYNAVDLQAGLQAAQHAAQRAQAQAVAEAEAEADAIAAAEAEAEASAKNRNKVHNDVKVNQPDPAPVPQRGGRNPQPPKSRAGGSNSAPELTDPSELRKLKDQLEEYKEEVTRMSVQIQAILQAVGQDLGVLREYAVQIGCILPFAGRQPPEGFLLCQGQPVSRTTYAQLFQIIGTLYGDGDKVESFNVPDLRGRTPYGAQPNAEYKQFAELGAKGGTVEERLTVEQIPSHTHPLIGFTQAFNHPFTNTFAAYGAGYSENSINLARSEVGGGGAHNNMPPFLVTNFVIKY